MNKFSVDAIIGMAELNSMNLFTTLLDMWKKTRQSQVKWMSMSEKENDKKFQIRVDGGGGSPGYSPGISSAPAPATRKNTIPRPRPRAFSPAGNGGNLH